MMDAPPLPLTRSTCFLHPAREAAARCVGCGKAFCRECVTPVERRMFCASCLKAQTSGRDKPRRDWFLLSVAGQAVVGLVGLWFTAYFLGRVLLELPSSFHEGTLWLKFIE